jgi:hypothetical protein
VFRAGASGRRTTTALDACARSPEENDRAARR